MTTKSYYDERGEFIPAQPKIRSIYDKKNGVYGKYVKELKENKRKENERKDGECPQCRSLLVYPRGGEPYCEDCGWPDEDFDA